MWGVPAPSVAAPAVALLEVIGGIALIVGLGTRLFSMLLAVVMIGAIILVKADVGVIASERAGAEADIANLGGLLALMLLAPVQFRSTRKSGWSAARPRAGRS